MSKRSNEDTYNPPAEELFTVNMVNERGSFGIDYAGGENKRRDTTRIAIYLRVSTTEQNVDNQLPMIETYLRANFPRFTAQNPWANGHQQFDVYWDHESGKTTDRTAWALLFNTMKKKKYDHIVTWHVDRVSRNIEQFSRILRYARAADCTMHFVALSLRSDSPMMEFMAKFFCLWAEHEVALKEMRQKEGIARRRKAGLHMGRLPDMTKDVELFELLRSEPDISVNKVAKHFGKSRNWAKRAIDRVS